MDPNVLTINLNEQSISTKSVVTNKDEKHITATKTPIGEGINEYSFGSRIILGREAITHALTIPLRPGPLSHFAWENVSDGLNETARLSRHVNKVSKNLTEKINFSELRPAARQLASVLRHDQNYQTTEARIPVFLSYAQASMYVNTELSQAAPDDFIERIADYFSTSAHESDELNTLRRESPFAPLPEMPEDKTFEELIKSSQNESNVYDFINKLDSSIQVDVVAAMLEGTLFKRFPRVAVFDGDTIHGGGFKNGVYIRNKDLPAHISSTDTTRVFIGPQLRDKQKSTGLDRYRVEFRVQAPRFAATPEMVWQTKTHDDGKVTRRLVFHEAEPRYDKKHELVIYKSSIAGAAIFASMFGQDIDYGGEMKKIHNIQQRWRSSTIPRAAAGMWPIVSSLQQNKLLNNSYIHEIEFRLEEAAQERSWSDGESY